MKTRSHNSQRQGQPSDPATQAPTRCARNDHSDIRTKNSQRTPKRLTRTHKWLTNDSQKTHNALAYPGESGNRCYNAGTHKTQAWGYARHNHELPTSMLEPFRPHRKIKLLRWQTRSNQGTARHSTARPGKSYSQAQQREHTSLTRSRSFASPARTQRNETISQLGAG